MSSNFHVTDKNPNDVQAGGCVCHQTKSPSCKPPYVVFPGQEMASNVSPHCVMCQNCALEAVAKMSSHVAHRAEQDAAEAPLPEPVFSDEVPGSAATQDTGASLEGRFANPDPEKGSDDIPEV